MKKTTYTKKDKVKLPKKRSKEKLDKEIEKLENEKLDLTNVYKYKK